MNDDGRTPPPLPQTFAETLQRDIERMRAIEVDAPPRSAAREVAIVLALAVVLFVLLLAGLSLLSGLR